MSRAGTILLLTGPSSGGKTTLALALRERVGAECAIVGIDDVLRMYPPEREIGWAAFRGATQAALRCMAALAEAGGMVIGELVLERPELYDLACAELAAHEVRWIGVTASKEVLATRERTRPDARRPGMAVEQAGRVLQYGALDLLLDTTRATPAACVERILRGER